MWCEMQMIVIIKKANNVRTTTSDTIRLTNKAVPFPEGTRELGKVIEQQAIDRSAERHFSFPFFFLSSFLRFCYCFVAPLPHKHTHTGIICCRFSFSKFPPSISHSPTGESKVATEVVVVGCCFSKPHKFGIRALSFNKLPNNLFIAVNWNE